MKMKNRPQYFFKDTLDDFGDVSKLKAATQNQSVADPFKLK